jgi:hypothetical protein
MEATRCKKCGRTLRDPESIARGMGPECVGRAGGNRKKYCSHRKVHRGHPYSLGDEGTAFPTLFTLIQKEGLEDVLPAPGSPSSTSNTQHEATECSRN